MNTTHFQFWPKRLPKELYYPQVPIFYLAETAALYYPEKTAIDYYGKEITYSEFHDRILRLATALNQIGVKKGDRVALYLQNSPQFCISYFGIIRANAVVVPLNPMLLADELAFLLQDSGAKVVITAGDLLPRVEAVKQRCSLKEIIVADYKDYLVPEPTLPVPESILADYPLSDDALTWENVMKSAAAPPPVEVNTDDICILPYTAGSTGIPKGCIHTSQTVLSNVLGAYHWVDFTSTSSVLTVLPLFHVTGLIHSFLTPVFAGSKSILLSRWDRETALLAIEKYQLTHWMNISTMVIDLLGIPDIDKRDLSSLVFIGGGGAPLPKAVGAKLIELTGLSYVEGYGLTETISQTHFNQPDRPKLQCIGLPHFGVDARIVDTITGEELPPGKEGELIVDGPAVFKGYWNRPEEDQLAFMELDGKVFFKTGDVCYMDEEGYFFIVDRTKRMINVSGFKVWPAEVESLLFKHPDVQEACVVGVPHPIKTEEVRAYIALKEQARGKTTEEDIIEWARSQMSAYKYPRQIVFIESLPKSGAGKVLWRELQEKAKQESS